MKYRYSTRFTKPGEFEELHCLTCKTLMEVKRNVDGPTGFAEALAKKEHLHDEFTCQFDDEMWHKQAYKLKEAAEDVPSRRIADMMLYEAERIIESRRSTKDVSILF